ncbi:hypothetical protein SRHO_G00185240 [Serrasalmus rhombeus]
MQLEHHYLDVSGEALTKGAYTAYTCRCGMGDPSFGGQESEVHQKLWQPSFYIKVDKEIHYFAGHEISIWESLDSYGGTIWPAYLDMNRGTVNLLDKAVLEIGAGTGLVSIVASLLGAWVTASDLPEALGNLRSNLSRNTRGCCRYKPQVAELSWGYELEQTFPRSVYRYDYVFAADVVYHHDFLEELLVTMRHFCQPGTTLIWANKIRFGSDLAFLENFKMSFNTTLLADTGEVKIYSATTKEPQVSVMVSEDEVQQKEEEREKEEEEDRKEEEESETTEDVNLGGVSNGEKQDKDQIIRENRKTGETNDNNCEAELKKNEDEQSSLELEIEEKSESYDSENNAQAIYQRSWAPCVYYRLNKEIHYFMGHQITIQESIDSYGGMIWPAAVALCKFLETSQEQINLLDQETLELGAGTGLLSVAAILLGAKLTATDLPDLLSNLRCNLNRNTRGHRRHEPRVAALSWGHELEQRFPHSEYHYDYVLAADVVYHHGFLDELLLTMQYFCQPGTTLIWANKVRYPSDLVFIENFKKAFNVTLLTELDEVRIYLAANRQLDEEDDHTESINKKKGMENGHNYRNETKRNEQEKLRTHEYKEAKEETESHRSHANKQNPAGEESRNEKDLNNGSVKNMELDRKERQSEDAAFEQKVEDEDCEPEKEENEQEKYIDEKVRESADCLETNGQLAYRRAWEPNMYYMPGKEIHYFLGHKITIEESIDSYGAMIWPAAVALCKFLETPAGQQQINLLDKSVLEIGAGTGLLSVAATLLGARLTATDLPGILSNLRFNLNRNTRSVRRHEPNVMELSWGHMLEETFPQCSYHYDYVLAADVVYHHGFLDELLVTMYHFCQPGTTIIWANKIRYPSDLVFVENFKKTFNATLIAELDEVQIYSATHRALGEKDDLMKSMMKEEMDKVHNYSNEEMRNEAQQKEEEVKTQEYEEAKQESESKGNLADNQNPAEEEPQNEKDCNNSCISGDIDIYIRESEDVMLQKKGDDEPQKQEDEVCGPQKKDDKQEKYAGKNDRESEHAEKDEESQGYSESKSTSSAHTEERSDCLETSGQSAYRRAWEPNMYYMPGKEIHYFLDHKISIEESIDSYGAVIWPAAVALCKYLETPEGQEQINLLDKTVLEIGAGTGLLSIVATLLGAILTATDLPGILSNLRFNLNRNTRSVRRHEPKVMELSWGHMLEETFPQCSYHYDYVLAADVVYHHGFLDELLVTMHHFCQPGTTIIWANKIRYPSDLVFVENFMKTFNATLIAELDEVRIYKGTHKCSDDSNTVNRVIKEEDREDKEGENCEEDNEHKEKEEKNEALEKFQKDGMMEQDVEEEKHGQAQDYEGLQPTAGATIHGEREKLEEGRKPVIDSIACHRSHTQSVPQQSKEIHYFVGHEISIEDSTDFFGVQRRSAALALCRFLDSSAGRQKIKLLDKSVLELGAGTGLVSIVATLLGANVTATDLPEVLGSLRCNLNWNTRQHRRYEPQVAALFWGHELEQRFPQSEYHYDYVMAADVVYHHDFLDELLVTMQYFCQWGTTLIWANEVHYPSDLVFTENFKKAFHATLIAELDEVKIYSATTKELGTRKDVVAEKTNFTVFKGSNEEVSEEENLHYHISADNEMTQKLKEGNGVVINQHGGEIKGEELSEEIQAIIDREENRAKCFMESQKSIREHKRCHIQFETEITDKDEGYEKETTDESRTEVTDYINSNIGKKRSVYQKVSEMDRKLCEERYYFAGHEIRIVDSFEPYGPTVRPAALALCKFLETNPKQINLKSKAVLELGAGTGLVSIVASLLGAWVTATDKPAVLDNLSSNLSSNTRGLSKHAPQVEALSWNNNLSRSFPRATYHYDVVLAADVVHQHNLLDDLLATMRHFCQPGTTLIWANRVRTQTETTFTERFKRTFSTKLLAQMEEVEIYMAKAHGHRWT